VVADGRFRFEKLKGSRELGYLLVGSRFLLLQGRYNG